MLDHVSIAVSDLGAAEPFYDAIMAALGVSKVGRSDNGLGYGDRCDADHPQRTYLSVKLGEAAMPVFSRHWCFKAPNTAAVDWFWQAGIANGGIDDGPPGLRTCYHPSYYAAFLIDPSGNRLEAVCHQNEQS